VKNLSAALAGLVPAVLLSLLNLIVRDEAKFFLGSLAAIVLCLIIYTALGRWHHPAVLTLLSLACPLLYYVYVAVAQPVFLPLFYGGAILVIATGCLGALVVGKWSWQAIGINIAFLSLVILLIIGIGALLEVAYIEAGLLAAGAFGITRMCEVNLIRLFSRVPRMIYKGMEKIWS